MPSVPTNPYQARAIPSSKICWPVAFAGANALIALIKRLLHRRIGAIISHDEWDICATHKLHLSTLHQPPVDPHLFDIRAGCIPDDLLQDVDLIVMIIKS